MNLNSLKKTLDGTNGVLQLPLIKNKKTVNPRDSDTPAVFQLETAMGSAIECFDDAGAVVVPRERFAPVKTCNDLFALRSDVYKVQLVMSVPCLLLLFVYAHADIYRYLQSAFSLIDALPSARQHLYKACKSLPATNVATCCIGTILV